MESQRPSPPSDPLPNWVAWGLLGVLLTTGLIAVGLDWEDWRGYTLALAVSMCFLGWGMWRSTRRMSSFVATVRPCSSSRSAAAS